jgi:hypothetical protein
MRGHSMMKGIAFFLIPFGAFVAAAQAADLEPAKGENAARPEWALQITPYLWAAGIHGDISPFRRAPTLSVDKSFSDIMEDLNLGGFIDVWGRYDRFGFSGDLMYVDTTDSHTLGALPVVGPTPGLSADVDTVEFQTTLKAGYRVYDGEDASFDVLAGARFWHISNDLHVRYAGFSRSYGEDFGWVDPVIGFRAFYNLTPRLSLQGQADFGGFGVGSDHTWQALATINYVFSDRLSASAGYKLLNVDYESDGHVFDTTLRGPVVGLTFRF